MSTQLSSIARFRKLLWSVGLALALFVLLVFVTNQPLSSQGDTEPEIGLGAYQFLGRIDQEGALFTAYGYIYDIQGVSPADLTSDLLDASEKTAYLTYYATATLTSNAVITDALRSIFSLNSVGVITYYYQATPSASFSDPQSFVNGTAVTTATTQFQDILSVQGPNRGLAIGNGEFTVTSTSPFPLGGKDVRFGSLGRTHQISTFGDAVRTDPIIPQSSVLLAGNAVSSSFWRTLLPNMTKAD